MPPLPDGDQGRPADWLGALIPRLPRVVRGHLPGAPIDRRRRELVAGVVSAALGQDGLAHIHAAWHDLLGPAELSEIDDEVLAWAIEAVEAGPGAMGPATLPDDIPPAAREALVALVVHAAVVAQTCRAGLSLVDRLRGRDRRPWPESLTDLAVWTAGAGVSVPVVVAGAAAGAIQKLLPPAPVVRVVDEPNLLAQLLAETLPVWFGGAPGRVLVHRLPVAVPIAVRTGRSTATVVVGRGELHVHNGVTDGVWAVFDGDVDGLLRTGARSLSREVRAAGLRR